MKSLVVTLLGLFVWISSASASQKVLLYSSMDLKGKGPFYAQDVFDNRLHDLENVFKEYFSGSDYELVVKYKATQDDVYQALHDTSVVGMFWVSHMGYQNGLAIINDVWGFDILPAFMETHQNFRFLGLIGCYGKNVIEFMKSNGGLKAPYVKASGDEGIVYRWGHLLKSQLKEFSRWGHFKSQNIAEAPLVKNFKIKRALNGPNKIYPAIRLELSNHKVIGTLPAGQPGEIQSSELSLPENYFGDIEIKVGLNGDVLGGNLSNQDISLGGFSIVSSNPIKNWKEFLRPDGNPFGIARTVFRYIGEKPSLPATADTIAKTMNGRLISGSYEYLSSILVSKENIQRGTYEGKPFVGSNSSLNVKVENDRLSLYGSNNYYGCNNEGTECITEKKIGNDCAPDRWFFIDNSTVAWLNGCGSLHYYKLKN